MTHYKEMAQGVFGFMGTMAKEIPATTQGFIAMHEAAGKNGAISAKHKELMSLGIAICIRCEGCIACHVQGSLAAGATKEEILETIGVALVMGGGPSVAYGEKAYKAMEEMM